ncbi:MAG: universal stress protein [Chloroflexota bacterium]|nr:universal stress protein [Chloroflexota bacterium]
MKKHYSKVLVPIIGTETDLAALEVACAISRINKAKLSVVYVIQVKRSLPLDAELEPEIRKAEQALRQAEDIADQQEWQVTTDLLQAREAGPAIVNEAKEREVDVILMGMDYKKRFGEFDLGETVSYVLKNAPCHVLLLRQPLP